MSEIIENIKEKIENKEIEIKPKYYFILGTVFIFLAMIGSFLVSTFFITILFYRARVFGLNLAFLLDKTPWMLVILTVLFFVSGIYLLKKYDISYKTSILLIIFLTAIAIVSAAYIADRRDMHRPFRQNPQMKMLFERNSPDGLYKLHRPMKPEVESLNHRRWN